MALRAMPMLLVLLQLPLLPAQDREVVAYVSHDDEHSRRILDLFEKESGIDVRGRYDTEQTKTVGLVKQIIEERASPVCDVFWNNECGQTERLKTEGLLQPYRSPQAEAIPARFKDPDGHWTGFGARARVLVWNTDMIAESELPARLEDLPDMRFRGRLAMAQPLTGTTLTHVCALYTVWREERTDTWLDGMMANEVSWEMGNGPVAQKVAEGVVPMGLTDTDDVNGRREDGYPVRAHYLDQGTDGLGTFVIPNSVMILKGAPHPEEAKALVDFLLSPRVEKLLAEGRAAQMPLHPGVEVPPHVTPVSELQTMEVDFGAVGEAIAKRSEDLGDRFSRVQGGTVVAEDQGGGGTALLWAVLALVLAAVFVWLAVRPRGGGSGA